MDKLFSVIMPVHNSASYLREAVESVLTQTFQDFELIIIDDSSSDNSLEIIYDYQNIYPDKIKVYSFDINQGAAAARNKGIELSNGQYFVFTDSDDIQDKERLQRIKHAFENKEVDMVFNDCLMIDELGNSLNRNLGYPEDLHSQNALLISLKRNYFFTSLSAVKNEQIVKFDTTLKHSEDYDLFLKLIYLKRRFKILKKPLVKYRIHPQNTSKDYQGSKMATIKILNKYEYNSLYSELKDRGHCDKEIYNTFGVISLIKGEYKEAVQFLNKGQNIIEGSLQDEIDNIFYLGVAYYKEKNFTKSYYYFKKLYLFNNEEPTVLNNLAVLICLIKNNTKKAEKLLRFALNYRPGYMDALYNLKKINVEQIPDKITEKFLRTSFVHTNI